LTWAYASAAQAGPGKERVQDACAIRSFDRTLVLAVSDGAGSAPLSHIGATVASRTFSEQANPLVPSLVGSGGTGFWTEEDAFKWASTLVERIAEAIRAVAEQEERPIAEYAATLVGVVISPEGSLFVQVGDGIAVFRKGDQLEVAIQPEEAEFVNSTYFLTDANVQDHIQLRVIEGPLDEVALLTDGLQPLVLAGADAIPHERFFETVFRNIRSEAGEDSTASAWLASMLASDLVTSRTDDDTSIVAAVRTAD